MNMHTKVQGKHGEFAIEAKGLIKRFKSGKNYVEVL
ncbi:MAG: ABC transporter ATP-binding protein, partial [Brevundimonas sp.]